MKRAWFQRIRGGGCQTLVFRGKTHVLPPCFVLPSSLSHPTSSTSYFFIQPPSLRMVAGGWGSYCFWEWGGRTVSPLAHTPTPPTAAFTLLSHVFQLSQWWSVCSLHGRFFLMQSRSMFISVHKGAVHAHKGMHRRRLVRLPHAPVTALLGCACSEQVKRPQGGPISAGM